MKIIATLAVTGFLLGMPTAFAEDFMPFGGDDNNTNMYNDGSGYGYGDGSGRGRGSGEFTMNFSGKGSGDMETDQSRSFYGQSNNSIYNSNSPYGYAPYGYGQRGYAPGPYAAPYGMPVAPRPPAPATNAAGDCAK